MRPPAAASLRPAGREGREGREGRDERPGGRLLGQRLPAWGAGRGGEDCPPPGPQLRPATDPQEGARTQSFSTCAAAGFAPGIGPRWPGLGLTDLTFLGWDKVVGRWRTG